MIAKIIYIVMVLYICLMHLNILESPDYSCEIKELIQDDKSDIDKIIKILF